MGLGSITKLLLWSLLIHLLFGSIINFGTSSIRTAAAQGSSSSSLDSGYEAFVRFRVKDGNNPVRRILGRVTVWKPKVTRPDDYSLGKVSVVRVDRKTQNVTASMEVGYIVFPSRYGDNTTRLYSRWENIAANGTKTGCFDFDCKGFVPTQAGRRYLGSRLAANPGQTESAGRGYTLDIQQISLSGNWVLRLDGLALGNWPASLFTTGNGRLNAADFGGEVYDSTGNTRPTSEMGNGFYPTAANVTGAYIYDVLVATNRRIFSSSTLFGRVTSVRASNKDCYTANIVGPGQNSRISTDGIFLYGGPGCAPQ